MEDGVNDGQWMEEGTHWCHVGSNKAWMKSWNDGLMSNEQMDFRGQIHGWINNEWLKRQMDRLKLKLSEYN